MDPTGRLHLQRLLYQLKRAVPNVQWAYGSIEHAPTTGMRHYHVYVRMTHYTSMSSNKIREATGYFAHMARADLNWLDYLLKEEGVDTAMESITQDEINNLRQDKVQGKWDRADQILRTGGSFRDIAAEMGGFAAQNESKLRQYEFSIKKEIQTKIADAKSNKWQVPSFEKGPENNSDADAAILKWLAYVTSTKSYAKQCHLWVWGSTNCGKTEWWKAARENGLRVFLWNPNKANWQDDWTGEYDIIVIEELNPNLKEDGLSLQKINMLLDGNAKLSVKYQPAIPLEMRIPIYICSNQNPREMWLSEPSELREAVFGRFFILQVHHANRINLFMSQRAQQKVALTNFYDNSSAVPVFNTYRETPPLQRQNAQIGFEVPDKMEVENEKEEGQVFEETYQALKEKERIELMKDTYAPFEELHTKMVMDDEFRNANTYAIPEKRLELFGLLKDKAEEMARNAVDGDAMDIDMTPQIFDAMVNGFKRVLYEAIGLDQDGNPLQDDEDELEKEAPPKKIAKTQ